MEEKIVCEITSFLDKIVPPNKQLHVRCDGLLELVLYRSKYAFLIHGGRHMVIVTSLQENRVVQSVLFPAVVSDLSRCSNREVLSVGRLLTFVPNVQPEDSAIFLVFFFFLLR